MVLVGVVRRVRGVLGFVGFQRANSPLWTRCGAQFHCQRVCGDAASGFLLILLLPRGPGSRFRRVGGFGVLALKGDFPLLAAALGSG